MKVLDVATLKTFLAIRKDMRALYDRFSAQEISRADAAELANIAGKAAKIEQLRIAGIALDRSLKEHTTTRALLDQS